jgi:hypothetical protein
LILLRWRPSRIQGADSNYWEYSGFVRMKAA